MKLMTKEIERRLIKCPCCPDEEKGIGGHCEVFQSIWSRDMVNHLGRENAGRRLVVIWLLPHF